MVINALPGTRPEQIGLDPNSVVETYNVTLNSSTSVLFSSHTTNAKFYANPSVTVEGGGTQVYSRDLKANATFVKQ